MTARTHDAIAFASLVTVATYYPPETLTLTTLFTAIVANIVGSLIPDMDQASNRLWDLLPAGDQLAKVFRRIFFKHRTLTHSLLGVFLIFFILQFILTRLLNPSFVDVNVVFFATMIGYISHLAADSLTKDGLPLLFPLKIDFGFPPMKFLRITTGSWAENFVILPGVAAYFFWFAGKNQSQLLDILRLVTS